MQRRKAMEFLIIAFKSREESTKFNKLLKDFGINSSLTSTPKEAGLACGLSVRVDNGYYYAVRRVLNNVKSKTFVGIFSVKVVNGRNVVKTIY